MQNKEIEKDKENIKIYIHDWYDSLTDEDGYEIVTLDENDKDFIKSIETILQYIDQLETKVKELEIKSNKYGSLVEKIQKYCRTNIKQLNGGEILSIRIILKDILELLDAEKK